MAALTGLFRHRHRYRILRPGEPAEQLAAERVAERAFRPGVDDRLIVEAWPVNSTQDAHREHFPPTAWDQAIDRARQLAADGRKYRIVVVVDAMRLELVKFTPYWIYRP